MGIGWKSDMQIQLRFPGESGKEKNKSALRKIASAMETISTKWEK